MADILDQAGDILEAKEREVLEASYKEARLSGDWHQAHDRLLELAITLLERSTGIIRDMRLQQEATRKDIRSLEKRLTDLLRK